MDQLLGRIEDWFAKKDHYFRVFADSDSRLEGWFKAELLVLFDGLRRQNELQDFDREHEVQGSKSMERYQIDFRLKIQDQYHYCELKALCISQALGTPRNLKFYFRDDHVGVIKDLRKLTALSLQNSWFLAFVYPSPDLEAWSEAISSIPSELSQWKPTTPPPAASRPLYVSLWRG